MKTRDFWLLTKDTLSSFSDDKASLEAALAYYSIFSIGPMLIIVIAVAGAVFGEAAVRGELFDQLQGLVGASGADTIQSLVVNAHRPSTSKIASVIGLVTRVLGACGVVTARRMPSRPSWRVQAKPGTGLVYFLKTYVVSLAAIIGIGFLLMVSLVLSAALAGWPARSSASGCRCRSRPSTCSTWSSSFLILDGDLRLHVQVPAGRPRPLAGHPARWGR